MSCLDFVFDNAYPEDEVDAERRIRQKYPLLLHQNEKIELAYRDRAGKGRDKNYFTTHRILIKDGKGIGSKCKSYKSIPYSSIQAWEVETAGSIDGDSELRVWSAGAGQIKVNFAKDRVDLWEIQRFLNEKIKTTLIEEKPELKDKIDSSPPKMEKKQGTATRIIDFLGDNAKQIDPAEVEQMLKVEMPVLFANEKIELVFKSGRDYNVFTEHRYMIVNVKGITGKRIGLTTILWHTIKMYSVQTAGAFLDRDTEMYLYTNMVDWPVIQQDFRKNRTNLFEVQKCLSNHLLWGETVEAPAPFADIDQNEGKIDEKGFWWFRDNQRPIDAVEIDRQYHTQPKILMEKEHVEMAFKGWRDVTIFTNLRVIFIDPKGLIGKQVEYKSLPWKSIIGHSVTTAGRFVDFDCEVGFYTECHYYPGESGSEDSPPVDPRPLESFLEVEFNKNQVDMNAMNYYLSRRIMMLSKMEVGAPIEVTDSSIYSQPNTSWDKLLGYLGGDQTELDAAAMNAELHGNTKVLLDDETVVMAFKGGRDMEVFTNLRVLSIDVQGIWGHKISYHSTPYKSIKAWSVETAGIWDTDTELNLYTRNRWHMAKIEMDFRTGKVDIAQLNYFLSALIIGLPTDQKVDLGRKNFNSGNREANPINGSSFGILGNMWEIDAQGIDSKLRSDPCLLLAEEKVLRAFQSGRDVVAYTNRRLIDIDTKGISGKRVKYKSLPLRFVDGFKFVTAGPLDRDSEMVLYFDCTNYRTHGPPRVAGLLRTENSLLAKEIDIYEIGKMFTDMILFGKDDEEEFQVEPVIFPSWYQG